MNVSGSSLVTSCDEICQTPQTATSFCCHGYQKKHLLILLEYHKQPFRYLMKLYSDFHLFISISNSKWFVEVKSWSINKMHCNLSLCTMLQFSLPICHPIMTPLFVCLAFFSNVSIILLLSCISATNILAPPVKKSLPLQYDKSTRTWFFQALQVYLKTKIKTRCLSPLMSWRVLPDPVRSSIGCRKLKSLQDRICNVAERKSTREWLWSRFFPLRSCFRTFTLTAISIYIAVQCL